MSLITFVPTDWNEGAAPGISAAQLDRIEAGINDLANVPWTGDIEYDDAETPQVTIGYSATEYKIRYDIGAGLVNRIVVGAGNLNLRTPAGTRVFTIDPTAIEVGLPMTISHPNNGFILEDSDDGTQAVLDQNGGTLSFRIGSPGDYDNVLTLTKTAVTVAGVVLTVDSSSQRIEIEGAAVLALNPAGAAVNTQISSADVGRFVFRSDEALRILSHSGAVLSAFPESDGTTINFRPGGTKILELTSSPALSVDIITADLNVHDLGFLVRSTGSFVASSYIMDLTTGSGANVNIAGDTLSRSTSSLAVKDVEGVVDLAEAETMIASLRPIAFTSKLDRDDGRRQLGFGAEEVFAEAGDFENYDVRAIVAAVVRVLQG